MQDGQRDRQINRLEKKELGQKKERERGREEQVTRRQDNSEWGAYVQARDKEGLVSRLTLCPGELSQANMNEIATCK